MRQGYTDQRNTDYGYTPRRRGNKVDRARGRQRLAVVILVLLALVVGWCLFAGHRGESSQSEQSAFAPLSEGQSELPELSDSGLQAATLTRCTLYGTAFGVQITLPQDAPAFTRAQLVLSMGQSRQTWPLQYNEESTALVLSGLINQGVDIQQLPVGQGSFTLQLTGEDGTAIEWRLDPAPAAEELPLNRYTVTQNGANRLVTFYAGQNTLCLTVETCALPEEVYDIVLDPGHGADDGGSVWQEVYEKDVVLQIAKLTKAALEERGYKVFMTRDGTEDPEDMMAYTMYEPDGRVNTAQSCGAKLCLSLHLNSLDEYVSQGGVQIYAADKMQYGFAGLLAQSIADAAGTCLSDMAYYRIADGVFCRTMTRQDLDDLDAYAARKNFTPFDIPVGANYYYIIRETGGVITGAYMDGRNPDYGTNLYLDSNIGVETYLCELGFLSVKTDRTLLLQNPEGYAKGIALAVAERFGD